MSDYIRSRGCGFPLFSTPVTAEYVGSSSASSSSGSVSCICPETQSSAALSCPLTTRSSRVWTSSASSSSREGCTCCKASMRDALKLLCSNQISDLLDFDGFAFLTSHLIVGARPTALSSTARDNLSDLSGTFRRFSPCNCDLIDISGTVYSTSETSLEVSQATLCSLAAIVFQVNEETSEASSSYPYPDTPEARYRRVRELLQRELQSVGQSCGECQCHCDCTDDCCCAESVLAALSSLSLNKRASLTAGPLLLQNVSVLGTIGNVLVLGNDQAYRFYFVCANQVEFLA